MTTLALIVLIAALVLALVYLPVLSFLIVKFGAAAYFLERNKKTKVIEENKSHV